MKMQAVCEDLHSEAERLREELALAEASRRELSEI